MSAHGEEGTSQVKPINASDLKKNTYVMMGGRPCQVKDISGSKTGKHGSMKFTFSGLDIFTKKQFSGMEPGHANMLEPVVTKHEYQLLDIGADNDNHIDLSCLNDANEEVTVQCLKVIGDEKNPLYKQIQEAHAAGKNIIVMSQMAPCGEAGKEVMLESVMTWKEDQSN